MRKTYIGFARASALILENVHTLSPERRGLTDCLDAIAAEDIHALVDAPSASTSLKDGYAVRSADISRASSDNPVKLSLNGVSAAGALEQTTVQPYSAVRILTGGRIPLNADAVVAEEFTRLETDGVIVEKITEAGRNILTRGADVTAGERIAEAGERLTPGRLGLVTAAGKSHVQVYRKPRISIIATGDEILLPGNPLQAGQLYASNAVTLEAWCRRFNCETVLTIVPDQRDPIMAVLRDAVETRDAVLTSGGAWSGERDLVRQALEGLGWQKVFHRVRLGPGKATGMGLVGHCPVFMLPGGPPSNLIGFLKLAMPGILKIGGHPETGLPQREVLVSEAVQGQEDWTQAIFGHLAIDEDGRCLYQPDRQTSRLKAMGDADALLTIPEGVDRIAAGTFVAVEILV